MKTQNPAMGEWTPEIQCYAMMNMHDARVYYLFLASAIEENRS